MGLARVTVVKNRCTCLQQLSSNKLILLIRLVRHVEQYMTKVVKRHSEGKPTRTFRFATHKS